MRATGNGNDLLLFQRAAALLCDWRRRIAVRGAAQRGTAQVLRWQSQALCDAAKRVVMDAERLVAQSRRLRQGSTGA